MSNKNGSDKKVVLSIKDMLAIDAFEISSTRAKVKLIHETKDIKCAGDELEIEIREKIQKRLPKKYHVGHGHIVDSDLNTSKQIDIVITDTNTPYLMKSNNSTEYIPYESVYSYGEIKTTYKKEHIEEFINRIKDTNSRLIRNRMPNHYFANGSKFSNSQLMTTNAPYNNPIFKFLIICDSGDLNNEKIYEELKDYFINEDYKYLPNCVLFLDKGLILNCIIENVEGENHIRTININTEYLEPGKNYKWTFTPFGLDAPNPGAHWGIFIGMLYDAIISGQLETPSILNYFRSLNRTYPDGKILSPMNEET